MVYCEGPEDGASCKYCVWMLLHAIAQCAHYTTKCAIGDLKHCLLTAFKVSDWLKVM